MFKNMEEIKELNKRTNHFFFDYSAMLFFDSRIESGVIKGRYFITSEQFHGSDGYSADRRYTVRRAEDDGSITDIGGFQAFPSVQAAFDFIQEECE